MEYLAEFHGYKLREVDERDYARLEEWIAADPYHASLFDPDYFLGREANGEGEMVADPRASCYALEDGQGTVFYIRLSRATRVNIQFPPVANHNQRKRVAMGLMQGMAYLEVALSRAGSEEWIFNSNAPQLRHLAENALSFKPSTNELVRTMAREEERDVRRS